MNHIIHDKRILVGLSGGIACYKTCDLVSRLVQLGASVRVVMTRNAARFVGPLTLQALSSAPVHTDTFEPAGQDSLDHLRLAEFAEIFVIVPATANILAKMAQGLADDLLSTCFLAAGCPVLAAPAMETKMYLNPATQANIALLESRGVRILHPESGHLASGAEGVGRLPDRERIIEKIVSILGAGDCLKGKTVLVTAGPTREALDPVRYLSNHSSGRMGFALARAAVRLGAKKVHLVSGPTALPTPLGVSRHDITTAAEMLAAVLPLAGKSDLVLAAAAVSDFAPETYAPQKLKKGAVKNSLKLVRTPDILEYISKNRKPGAVVFGFALETENEIEHGREKLHRKALDFIAINNPLRKGAGFGGETNRVAVLDSAGGQTDLPLMSKEDLAGRLLELAAGAMKP